MTKREPEDKDRILYLMTKREYHIYVEEKTKEFLEGGGTIKKVETETKKKKK